MDKMYDEGGLATDGMDVDPVSGNDIPVGSNATDVRDDVDAKLSTGEYVVPADVVKYVGVAQLEKLVDKAKAGLEEMDADGRIGGEPTTDVEEVTLGGDLSVLDGYATGGMVAGTDIDGIINRVKAAAMKDPSIINMLKAKGIFVQEPQPQGQLQQQAMSQGAVPAQAAPPSMQGKAEPAAFAEGGLSGPSITPFNPYAYTPGFSAETSVTGRAPGQPAAPAAPVAGICEPGFVWDAEKNMCVPVETPQATSSGGSSSTDTSPAPNPNAWMDKFDYSNPDTLFEQTMTSIGAGDKEEDKSLVGSLLGLAGGALAGGVIGKFVSANNAAQASANAIILRKAGKIEEADELDKAIAAYAKDKGIDKFSDFTTGKALADSVAKEQLNTIRKWELGGGANLVTPGMVEKGKTTAAKGDSRATTWEGGQVVANQNKPVYNDDNGSSNADEAMAAAQASRRESAQRAADKLGQPLATGGRATGGLVGPRPSKTKTKPKGKRGLGSK
jgi:hypothetical protein